MRKNEKKNSKQILYIDAENEEEFIKEYENMKKSRLSELNFRQKSKEYIPENQYDEQDEEVKILQIL